jgi:site-specific recombinase XerD
VTEPFFTNPRACLGAGPVGPHLDLFVSLLSEMGYAKSTILAKLRAVGSLSQWLESRGLELERLNESTILQFVDSLPTNPGFIRGHRSAFWLLLEYLRDQGLIPPALQKLDDSPLGRILREFEHYLEHERGLAQATRDIYLPASRRFLAERFRDGSRPVNELRPEEVTEYVWRYARRTSPGSAKVLAGALRALLRFLRLRGKVAADLAAAVPTVARWSLSSVPSGLLPEEVDALLESCDRSSIVGQRDYTILLLLVQLGLRAGEIVAMRLGDLHWRAGELTVRGKGSRCQRLPMPQDVGEALATYLRDARPSCSSRRVFVRVRAPHRAFASSNAIGSMVARALARAGLNPACKGAHLLRHSLATEMVRKGASLAEIGQILRHRCPTTTELYAKVDLAALRELAPPWPGGGK